MASCNQRKLDTKSIDEQTERYFRNHEKEVEKSHFENIPEMQLDKTSLTQEFYKSYERQFSKYIVLKHGYRICRVERQEEDLAFYCFSLLQAQAKFPIKIFLIDHGKNDNPLDYDKSGLKMFWLETSIMVSGITFSAEKEMRFEKAIYKFYKEYLLPQMQKFMKAKINWDYMISPEYTDVKVIAEFKKEIVEAANREFATMVARI